MPRHLIRGNARVPRRQFVQTLGLAAAGAAFARGTAVAAERRISPNEKLNVGVIGVGGRGGENLREVAALENIVALCDVDSLQLGKAAEKFPQAKTYADFRRLIDQRDLDAIVISTPDHTHAVATAAALRSGRHVYCEKPLTHTVSEARFITDLARQTGLVTQIGTQIHAGDNYRRVVELVQSDAIGAVREVHVWAASSYGGRKQPKEPQPVPAHLDWDLWLGPAEPWPYHADYGSFNWRHWWRFGGGSLADFGCHFMDLPFWALGLKYPNAIDPVEGPPVDPHSTQPWAIVRYDFPTQFNTRTGQSGPACRLTWYHGGKRPEQLVPDDLYAKWKSGVLFVGEKGQLIADYGRLRLLPEEKFADFKKPEPFIAKTIGHHREWTHAIKHGGTPTCHFGYSGPLTETALLGNVAYRVGKRLEWDALNLRAKNCPEADELIAHHYRRGWKL